MGGTVDDCGYCSGGTPSLNPQQQYSDNYLLIEGGCNDLALTQDDAWLTHCPPDISCCAFTAGIANSLGLPNFYVDGESAPFCIDVCAHIDGGDGALSPSNTACV
jgi:hypothetical protein